MSDSHNEAGSNLFESFGRFGSTLLAMVQTRLELLGTDLEEGRDQVLAQFVLALVAVFALGVGIVLGSIALVVAFWDSHRVLVLSLLAGAFLLSGLIAGLLARSRIRTAPHPFASSLAELHQDQNQLPPHR